MRLLCAKFSRPASLQPIPKSLHVSVPSLCTSVPCVQLFWFPHAWLSPVRNIHPWVLNPGSALQLGINTSSSGFGLIVNIPLDTNCKNQSSEKLVWNAVFLCITKWNWCSVFTSSVFAALGMQDNHICPLSRAVFIEDERWELLSLQILSSCLPAALKIPLDFQRGQGLVAWSRAGAEPVTCSSRGELARSFPCCCSSCQGHKLQGIGAWASLCWS